MGKAELVLENSSTIDKSLDLVGQGVESVSKGLGEMQMGHAHPDAGEEMGRPERSVQQQRRGPLCVESGKEGVGAVQGDQGADNRRRQ